MDEASGFAPVAHVLRGGEVESWHFGAAAVVTPEGQQVGRVGDPRRASFLRSAAKPFQALPLLVAGGRERFALSDADLALICASHGATSAHVERVKSLLARGDLTEAELLCGAHEPLDEESARALRADGETAGAIHNNCSGKHAGMLLTCRLRGWPLESYLEARHPLQREILATLCRWSGVEEREVVQALDGCGVPTFRLPLHAAARAYAGLAEPIAAGRGEEAEFARAIVRAMTLEPEMVAGPGRFTTRLMAVTRGRILAKEGAEGFYGLAVLGPVALGIALKIADGGERCRDGVVLELLRQAGVLSSAELDELDGFYQPKRRNCRGFEVGEIVPVVELL